MTAASGKRLGKVLVRAELITEEQLESALALSADGRSLTAALVDEGNHHRRQDRAGGCGEYGACVRRYRRL